MLNLGYGRSGNCGGRDGVGFERFAPPRIVRVRFRQRSPSSEVLPNEAVNRLLAQGEIEGQQISHIDEGLQFVQRKSQRYATNLEENR